MKSDSAISRKWMKKWNVSPATQVAAARLRSENLKPEKQGLGHMTRGTFQVLTNNSCNLEVLKLH